MNVTFVNLQNSRGVLCIHNKSNPNCFSWWIHHLKANNNLIETSIMCSLWVSLVLRDEIHNSNLTTVINFFKYDMNAASVGYNRWNTSLPSGSWLPVKDVSTSLGLCGSQCLPPPQLPFSIMLPFCGRPLPRGRGSVCSAHFVCCNTLAAIWPPPSLPTISCHGMIMSSFSTPCFWTNGGVDTKFREGERVKERERERGVVMMGYTSTWDWSPYRRR